jgi:carbamoyl-phosphate synthase large subunit
VSAADRPTVLVIGADSNVTQGILKALALAERPLRVLAAALTPFAAGLYAVERAYLCPQAADPAFPGWLDEVCAGEGVRAVLSGVEPVLDVLAVEAGRIRARTGAVCIVSPPATLELGRDKLATCRWLAREALPHPRFAAAGDAGAVAALRSACGFPLIAKPRRGRASRGVVEVPDAPALQRLAGREDLLVQEHLGDAEEEYTVGCLCDSEGRLRGSVAMRRVLSDGTTVRAEVAAFDAVRALSERVVKRLAPVGPCNVQLRLAQGAPVPFELNVRFSGTTPVRARLGFNEVEAAVRHLALGEPARDLPDARHATAVRYWNELYLPADGVAQLERAGRLDHADTAGALRENWGPGPQ